MHDKTPRHNLGGCTGGFLVHFFPVFFWYILGGLLVHFGFFLYVLGGWYIFGGFSVHFRGGVSVQFRGGLWFPPPHFVKATPLSKLQRV